MNLEEEKKKIILKKLRKSAIKKLFLILIMSLAFGTFIILVMSFTENDINMYAKKVAFEIFTVMMFLFQLDDFLIAVCILAECLTLKKAEIKYYIANARQLKPTPWPLHLGRRMFNLKMVVYEYKGKSRTRIIWANVMARNKDYRLLLLVPENKRKNIYAFPLINFVDVMK